MAKPKRFERLLALFNEWFASTLGVYQTLLVVGGVCIIEIVNRSVDPSFLVLMTVLTVYSVITQPILAYVSSRSAKNTDKILDRMEERLNDEMVVDEATYDAVLTILEEVRNDSKSRRQR